MRGSLVKSIRATARTLFPDRPYVEYTTDARTGSRRLAVTCIKSMIQDTKRHIYYGR